MNINVFLLTAVFPDFHFVNNFCDGVSTIWHTEQAEQYIRNSNENIFASDYCLFDVLHLGLHFSSVKTGLITENTCNIIH